MQENTSRWKSRLRTAAHTPGHTAAGGGTAVSILRAAFKWTLPLLLVIALADGCGDSIKQYTRLGEWRHVSTDDKPLILSGSSQRDAAAYSEASDQLSAADWQVLEQIAPKPVWERIESIRQKLDQTQRATQPDVEAVDSSPGPRAAARPEVPVETLADGRVRIFYDMQHYGGSHVQSSVNGGTSRRNITIQKGNLKPVADMITQQLGGEGQAIPVPDQNALLITCQPEAKDQALALLGHIDVPDRQVEITVRLFEVSHDFDFQFGAKTLINHISSNNTQALASSFSAADFVGAVVSPALGMVPDPGSALRLMKVFTDSGLTLDATFQAMADTGLIKVVSSPRMTVRAEQTAYLLAGQELPIQSAKIANDQVITENISYKPVGVQLYITPQVIGVDSVKLHVLTQVSAVSGFAPLPSLDDHNKEATTLTNPILDSREAETNVSIGDGQTLVMGGLRMVRSVNRDQKIPGLGDVKGFGWLFKNTRSQRQISDLYFFVTPKILS